MALNWATRPSASGNFFLQILPVSCQFREFLSLFNVQEHYFHQFQGLRRPAWRAINIDYPLQAEVNNQSNCFSAQLGDFNYFMAEKHPNLKIGRMIT